MKEQSPDFFYPPYSVFCSQSGNRAHRVQTVSLADRLPGKTRLRSPLVRWAEHAWSLAPHRAARLLRAIVTAGSPMESSLVKSDRTSAAYQELCIYISQKLPHPWEVGGSLPTSQMRAELWLTRARGLSGARYWARHQDSHPRPLREKEPRASTDWSKALGVRVHFCGTFRLFHDFYLISLAFFTVSEEKWSSVTAIT